MSDTEQKEAIIGQATDTRHTFWRISIGGKEMSSKVKTEIIEAWGLTECRQGGIYGLQCVRVDRDDDSESFDFKLVELCGDSSLYAQLANPLAAPEILEGVAHEIRPLNAARDEEFDESLAAVERVAASIAQNDKKEGG